MRCSMQKCSPLFVLMFFVMGMTGLVADPADPADAPVMGTDEAPFEEIVSLARSGKNREAIARFEALPDDVELPLVSLRAVAGCYWREREFDKSRELYQEILDRRPTLQNLSRNADAAPAPLIAKEDPEEDPEEATEAVAAPDPDPEPREDPSAEAVEAVTAPDPDPEPREVPSEELTELRAANAALIEEREALREKVAAQIAKVTTAAQASVEDVETLRAELDKQRKWREVAEREAGQAQSALELRGNAVQNKVGKLEGELAAARGELAALQDVQKAEAEALAQAVEEVREERRLAASMVLEKDSLEAHGVALSNRVSLLETDLQSARASVEKNQLEANSRVAASEERAKELAVIVTALDSQSYSARSDIAELARALEDARGRNAELFAAQSVVVRKAESDIEALQRSSLRSALDEIDTLEREYAALDASAGKRQHELLMRIDALEQGTVTGESELAKAREQLKIERALRKAVETQGEKRDDAMLQANLVLAEAAEKMALQFDIIRSQTSGASGLKIADPSKTSADLAPLIGKLEAATESATVEVKNLRRLLAEEQNRHAESKAQAAEMVVSLRQQVELLGAEIETLKTKHAEREAELAADAERQLKTLAASLTAEREAREGVLQEEMSALGKQIEASKAEMELLRRDRVSETEAYAKQTAERDAAEQSLRERIRNLELAFALPLSEDAVPARDDGVGDPEVNERVDALYQSIIDTARKDKGLALTQFESLPAESVKPVTLLRTIANLYREKRAYDSAYAIYESLLVRNPGDLYVERKLVMTLFDMGRYDEALGRLAGPQDQLEIRESAAAEDAPAPEQ